MADFPELDPSNLPVGSPQTIVLEADLDLIRGWKQLSVNVESRRNLWTPPPPEPLPIAESVFQFRDPWQVLDEEYQTQKLWIENNVLDEEDPTCSEPVKQSQTSSIKPELKNNEPDAETDMVPFCKIDTLKWASAPPFYPKNNIPHALKQEREQEESYPELQSSGSSNNETFTALLEATTNEESWNHLSSAAGSNNKGKIRHVSSQNRNPVNKRSSCGFNSIKPIDFLAYATEKTQFIFSECRFIIQLLNNPTVDRSRTNLLSLPKTFKAMITDPAGFEYPAYLKTIPSVPNSFYGLFYPAVVGNYVISVFSPKTIFVESAPKVPSTVVREHVNGSPFSIMVSRNYSTECRRVLVRIGLYGLIDSGRNPSRCWGITADKLTDHIFMTNREQHHVSAFNAFGNLMFKFGQDIQNAPENLYRPTGISCDNYNRRLLVADKDNHRIAVYSLDGGFITSFGKFGHENGNLNYPWDVDCSRNGDKIIVSDSRNHRIQLFDRFGNYVNKFSAFETHPLSYKTILDNPRGICFDSEDKNIYVTDFAQESVTRISADFTTALKLTSNNIETFSRLQGITVDPIGNILVCDTRRNLLRVIDPDGTVLSSVGCLEDIPLYQPLDIVVMGGGNLAILDYNGRVRVF